jgi:hypothetical protein
MFYVWDLRLSVVLVFFFQTEASSGRQCACSLLQETYRFTSAIPGSGDLHTMHPSWWTLGPRDWACCGMHLQRFLQEDSGVALL